MSPAAPTAAQAMPRITYTGKPAFTNSAGQTCREYKANAGGRDERLFLEPLRVIVDGAPTQAEFWLQQYHGPWGGDVRPIFNFSDII